MPEMTLRPRVDETGGFNSMRELDPEKVIHLTGMLEVGSLAEGLQNGKPSVLFCFKLPDGRVVLAETSLELLRDAARLLSAAHGVT